MNNYNYSIEENYRFTLYEKIHDIDKENEMNNDSLSEIYVEKINKAIDDTFKEIIEPILSSIDNKEILIFHYTIPSKIYLEDILSLFEQKYGINKKQVIQQSFSFIKSSDLIKGTIHATLLNNNEILLQQKNDNKLSHTLFNIFVDNINKQNNLSTFEVSLLKCIIKKMVDDYSNFRPIITNTNSLVNNYENYQLYYNNETINIEEFKHILNTHYKKPYKKSFKK